MSHQSQLEKPKYRNWVRGGLAYLYLKEGIEGFADDFFQKEHARILGLVNNTSGTACNDCSLELLRQKNRCTNNMCNIIMGEIEKSHVSGKKANWKKIDIKKLYTSPWEVAKCFIDAPEYSNTEKVVTDLDVSGLLHLFINNKNLHTHLSCNMAGKNIFIKCREGRNKLFHSPAMKLEDTELTECIDDIIAILEDPKELAATADAQQAVFKLKELKQKDFIITTDHKAEVFRDALAYITNKTLELKQMIQETEDGIDKRHLNREDALKKIRDINLTIQSVQSLIDRMNKKVDNSQIIERLLEQAILIGDLKDKPSQLRHLVDKKELQRKLVDLYELQYVKTSLSPLKRQDNVINIEEVYVEPEMVLVESDKHQTGAVDSRFETRKQEEWSGAVESRFETGKQEDRPIHGYHDLFHSNGRENKAIYIVGDFGTGKTSFCKKMIQDWCKAAKSPNKGVTRDGNDKPRRTREMTDDRHANRTSRIAEKSSASSSDLDMSDKKSLSSDEDEMRKFDFLFNIQLKKKTKHCKIIDMIQSICTEETLASMDERMSHESYGLPRKQEEETLASTELVRRIFEQDSERCLIIIDGLDEWRLDNIDNIDKMDERMSHESYGLPRKQDIKNATVVTLSRPSALGMLNIKSSEMDQKVELKGIYLKTIPIFFHKYLSKLNKPEMAYDDLMRKFKESELRHLENTPLLLQQLVWLYCNYSDFGKSVSDIYSHLVNTMFGWLKTKGEESKARDKGNQYVQMPSPLHQNSTEESKSCCSDKGKQFEKMKLPKLLDRFPRCKENKSLLIPLARVAFESLTSKSEKGYLSRSDLESDGFSEKDVLDLIGLGILVEENCNDPTYDITQLSFVHMSYLEFFAAVYASCHFDDQQSDDKKSSVITELFPKVETAADILQLSNLLRMICGLCPFVITQVSLFISDIVKRTEKLIRQNKKELIWYSSLSHIRKLIFSFLSECDSTVTNDTMVYIADVFLDNSETMQTIRSIIPDNVISLAVTFCYDEESWKWMTQLKYVQYVYFVMCDTSHDQMAMLCSFLQEAPLRYIQLCKIKCRQKDCIGHSIDLSKHERLQKLEILECDEIKISNINTGHLETIQLAHTETLNFGLLQNSRCLSELRLGLPVGAWSTYRLRLKYNKDVDTVVHTLHQLQTLTLSYADIDENALIVTPEMRNLKHINLLNSVEMSLETWRKFVDRLLTLQQSVQVDIRNDTLRIDGFKTVEDKWKYVKGKENIFENIQYKQVELRFRTKKH